jgi:hypothetical protein
MVSVYEGGVNDITTTPAIVSVALNANSEWWYGNHQEVTHHSIYTDKQIVNAIILR